jgi:histidinol phosphatase-like PHP family hydrolase
MEVQLRHQAQEIQEVNDSMLHHSFRILPSIELNLSPQGAGEMDEDLLRKLDLVLGSFHTAIEDRACGA